MPVERLGPVGQELELVVAFDICFYLLNRLLMSNIDAIPPPVKPFVQEVPDRQVVQASEPFIPQLVQMLPQPLKPTDGWSE